MRGSFSPANRSLTSTPPSVRARKDRRLCSRPATAGTGARRFKPLELILKREDAERGAGRGLDLEFTGGRAAPACDEEAALGSIDVDELVPAGNRPRVGTLECDDEQPAEVMEAIGTFILEGLAAASDTG